MMSLYCFTRLVRIACEAGSASGWPAGAAGRSDKGRCIGAADRNVVRGRRLFPLSASGLHYRWWR